VTRAWISGLAALVAVSTGCRSSAPEVEKRSVEERLRGAIVGPGAECKRSSDCDSGVCSDSFCTPLIDAGQRWMELATAEKVRALIAEDARIVDLLHTEIAPELEGQDPYVRARFATLLGGLEDARFTPLLQKWAKDPVERVRVSAVLALGYARTDAGYDGVLELLDHRSDVVVLATVDTLGRYTSTSVRDDAIAELIDLLEHDDYRVRQRAVRWLGDAKAATPKVIAALRAILETDGDGYLRYDVQSALHALDAKN